MERWQQQAHEQIASLGLDRGWIDILSAFEAPYVPARSPGDLRREIVSVLSQEVDRDQAELFSRRCAQMQELLAQMDVPEARLLETFLAHRASALLEAIPPRALRIRALVDYVFGHAAVLLHRDPQAPPPEALVRRALLQEIAPGIAHATVQGKTTSGPVHINVLRLEGVALRAVALRPSADLAALSIARGADAAFSGGYFLYSEPDIAPPDLRGDPVGLVASEGRALSLPAFRRCALVQRTDGRTSISVLGPQQAIFRLRGQEIRPAAVGQPEALPPVAYSRAFGAASPDGPHLAVALAKGQVVAVGRGALHIPLSGLVLTLPDGVAPPSVGDPVEVSLDPELSEAMSGGPSLIGSEPPDLLAEDFAKSAPPITFSRDETHDNNLLPRLGAGIDAEGVLWVVAVDGRDMTRAPGLTLRGAGALLRALGCTSAMNLDGGSSKRMVIAGRTVDLPSTEITGGTGAEDRVRPVHSALLAFRRGATPRS